MRSHRAATHNRGVLPEQRKEKQTQEWEAWRLERGRRSCRKVAKVHFAFFVCWVMIAQSNFDHCALSSHCAKSFTDLFSFAKVSVNGRPSIRLHNSRHTRLISTNQTRATSFFFSSFLLCHTHALSAVSPLPWQPANRLPYAISQFVILFLFFCDSGAGG